MKAYQVLKEFELGKDYGFEIRPQYARCLAVMKTGDTITSNQFVEEHRNEFTTRKNILEANLAVIYKAISIGKKIGMLKETTTKSTPILYDDFCKLETIVYFRNQLRGSNRKNTKSKIDGTRDTYTRHLHYFNNWIFGKTIEVTREFSLDDSTYKKEKATLSIRSVEHFLKIYAENHYDVKPFVKLIKNYFLESRMQAKSASFRNNSFFAINEYFRKNDEPLNLTFDPNAGQSLESDASERIMTLDEFLKILTVGQPTITEKATFLCKFQRGLDSSTLVDRFNFEAWTQIVEAFGTSDYRKWDLAKCPVQINLGRVKTNVSHSGFLDKDAVSSVIDYLEYRCKITGKEMDEAQPLFLNNFLNPISESWITSSFSRLRKNAGLDDIINEKQAEHGAYKKYRVTPHETRDLLKSVLIDSNVRYDLAEEFIGHKTNDSYEKQTKLFTSTLRKEYIKASRRLNVFSNFTNFVKGHDSTEELQSQIQNLKHEQKVHIESQRTMLQILKQKQIIP